MNIVAFKRKALVTEEQKKAIQKELWCTLKSIHYSLDFKKDSAITMVARGGYSAGQYTTTPFPPFALTDEGDIVSQCFPSKIEFLAYKFKNNTYYFVKERRELAPLYTSLFHLASRSELGRNFKRSNCRVICLKREL